MQSFQLTIKVGPNPGKVYTLDKDQMVIGRDSLTDLVVPDAEVSRRHARIYMQGGGYVLEDLGSTNGCFVNGQRLSGPQPLRSGDTIMFGEKITLKYEVIQNDPEATIASMPSFAPPPPRPSNFTAPPPTAPVWEPAAPPPPPPGSEPMFSNQIPAGPEELALHSEPAKANKNRTWILAGCGCLLLVLCICGLAGYAFDSMNLYCVGPFDMIFTPMGFCTP